LALLLRLQDSSQDAIRILIVGEECELGVHEVNNKTVCPRIALDGLEAHGIAIWAAA
jgi:hypothetical protein